MKKFRIFYLLIFALLRLKYKQNSIRKKMNGKVIAISNGIVRTNYEPCQWEFKWIRKMRVSAVLFIRNRWIKELVESWLNTVSCTQQGFSGLIRVVFLSCDVASLDDAFAKFRKMVMRSITHSRIYREIPLEYPADISRVVARYSRKLSDGSI